MNSRAVIAARAVNNLLHIDSEDQQALLEVIEDYFVSTDAIQESDDRDSDRDSDSEGEGGFAVDDMGQSGTQ